MSSRLLDFQLDHIERRRISLAYQQHLAQQKEVCAPRAEQFLRNNMESSLLKLFVVLCRLHAMAGLLRSLRKVVKVRSQSCAS